MAGFSENTSELRHSEWSPGHTGWAQGTGGTEPGSTSVLAFVSLLSPSELA